MKGIPMKFQSTIAKFEGARAALEKFRKDNPDYADQYDALRDSYNGALKSVKTVFKDLYPKIGKSYGEWKISLPRKVDAEMLLELMGEEAQPLVRVEYKIDLKAYDKAVERGDIPGDIVAAVESEGAPRVTGGPKAQ
jgi:hypothetical protein